MSVTREELKEEISNLLEETTKFWQDELEENLEKHFGSIIELLTLIIERKCK